MAEISASAVKELRERTGLGMMECKKALTESNGDMQAAEQLLRIKSGAKANKMAGRSATEGAVAVYMSADKKLGALVELNCETDFVAKNEDFAAFGAEVANMVADNNPADVESLAKMTMKNGETVEKNRQDLLMKLGENLSIRRFAVMKAKGVLSTYLHGLKIGVMTDIEGGEATLGKDLAMHIAASKPVCVSDKEVPEATLKNEREIYTAQAKESGKPAEFIEKMVEGRMRKFLAEVTLLGQPFVKNPDQSVTQLLKDQKATAHAFTMFIVGEGLEKKSSDFAAEVAETMKAAKA